MMDEIKDLKGELKSIRTSNNELEDRLVDYENNMEELKRASPLLYNWRVYV